MSNFRTHTGTGATLFGLATSCMALAGVDVFAQDSNRARATSHTSSLREAPQLCGVLTLKREDGAQTLGEAFNAELTHGDRYIVCRGAGADVALPPSLETPDARAEESMRRLYPATLAQTVQRGRNLVIHPGTFGSREVTCATSYVELSSPGFTSRYVPTYGVARAVPVDPCAVQQPPAGEALARACASGGGWIEVVCDDYVQVSELVLSRERQQSVLDSASHQRVTNSRFHAFVQPMHAQM